MRVEVPAEPAFASRAVGAIAYDAPDDNGLAARVADSQHEPAPLACRLSDAIVTTDWGVPLIRCGDVEGVVDALDARLVARTHEKRRFAWCQRGDGVARLVNLVLRPIEVAEVDIELDGNGRVVGEIDKERRPTSLPVLEDAAMGYLVAYVRPDSPERIECTWAGGCDVVTGIPITRAVSLIAPS